ncbi:transposase [Streptomyces sp. NPDC051940]|uniref:transposase n=1 Tax=Streptomyces sp. NPDC051940 TaxID=3155675 RepID=UPI00342E3FA2
MGAGRYPEEFKRDAVELVRTSGRTVGSVARELGVNPESLRQWMRGPGPGPTVPSVDTGPAGASGR